MAKLKQLSPEQQADLRAWRQYWYEVGISTAPADHERAEAAVASIYQAIGRERPTFIWVPSPATGILAQSALSKAATNAESSLRSSLASSLASSLESSLRSSLRSSLEWSLRSSVVSLRSSLASSLVSLVSSLRSLESSLGSYWWGQHEAYWISYYTFGPRIGVVYAPDKAEQLNWWADLAKSCGWWAPYARVAIMCDRPDVCQMEPTGQFVGGMPTHRLHSESGPALHYRDGWGVWSWHGVSVPQKLIEQPESITREDLLKEQNAEVRRAYMERLGAGRFAQLLDLVEVDRQVLGRDMYAREYTLYRTREADPVAGEHIQFLNAICHSTEREYMLCVPPDIADARGARAWTFPLPEFAGDYDPIVET